MISAPAGDSSRSGRAFVLVGVLVALVVVAYTNSLHGPFMFDDTHEVVTNPSIEDLQHPLSVIRYNPIRAVTNLSYAVDYALWSGRDEFGFHLTNLVLHAINVILLFVLVRSFVASTAPDSTAANTTAFLAASLFAVHPMMTEAVSYISGRSDLLATTLFLTSLYAFRRGFQSGLWLIAGAISFLVALGTKETAAALPFVLLASDMLLSPAVEWKRRLWRIHVPLISVVLVGVLARIWLYVAIEAKGPQGFTWSNVATVAHVPVRYVGLLLIPRHQTIIPAISPILAVWDLRVIVTIVGLIAIIVIAVRARQSNPIVTFGLIWFGLALVPSSGLSLLVQTGQLMAEHRVYLASCGFFAAVAALVAQPAKVNQTFERLRVVSIPAGAAIVLTIFVVLTMARNRVWADSVLLWEEAARVAPETPAAQLGLADAYRDSGKCDIAAPVYERAIALRPDWADPYLSSAGCLVRRGRVNEARSLLHTAMTRVPRNDIRVGLALASIEGGPFANRAEALRLCGDALAIHGDSVEAQDCLRRYQSR